MLAVLVDRSIAPALHKGTLAKMAKKFGEEGININYVYGSALPKGRKSLFVFCPEDVELAARIFKD